MPKNIAVFCDGTWNSPSDEAYGAPTSTNVYRLYRASLDQAESDGAQITWYQRGLGALGGGLRRAWEGSTGTGTGANIRRGYAAIARHYRPGDRIFLVGFSRGAFAARSIAGMIERVGLLTDPTPENVDRAYRSYENARSLGDASPTAGERWPDVRVDFIGVWDTVGALGFSLWGWSFNLRLFRNGFHELSPNRVARRVCHALAMDEMRTSFMPTLWEPPGPDAENRPDVEQAWFRGVHSDVGGGYADRSLADVTLLWMMDRAEAHGLILRAGARAALRPDPLGRIHSSYRGPLWTNVAGWPRWFPPLNRSRVDPAADAIGYLDGSVFQRELAAGAIGSDERGLRRLSIGESCAVEVRADQLWNPTSLVLEAGGRYAFAAAGWWQDGERAAVGPEGQLPATESLLRRMARFGRRHPREPWMKLIGIVNHPRTWAWRERPLTAAFRYLVFEDPSELVGQLFPIGAGSGGALAVRETGVLWVFANDWWKSYESNTGAVRLQVTRVATT